MHWLVWVLIALFGIYAGLGCVMAFYEKSQTDDPWSWKTVVLWLPMMFGLGR
jgi:hypothetical protein